MPKLEHRSTSVPANGRFHAVWIGKFEWIIVPASRSWLMLIFYAIWLFFWVLGGFMAIYMLFTGEEQLFIALWLVGWALGVHVAFSTISWQLAGRFRITILDGALVHGWSMPFIDREQHFNLADIRDLEAVSHLNVPLIGKIEPKSYNPPMLPWTLSPRMPNSLMFTYAGKSVFLPLGLNEEESGALLEWLRLRAEAALKSVLP